MTRVFSTEDKRNREDNHRLNLQISGNTFSHADNYLSMIHDACVLKWGQRNREDNQIEFADFGKHSSHAGCSSKTAMFILTDVHPVHWIIIMSWYMTRVFSTEDNEIAKTIRDWICRFRGTHCSTQWSCRRNREDNQRLNLQMLSGIAKTIEDWSCRYPWSE